MAAVPCRRAAWRGSASSSTAAPTPTSATPMAARTTLHIAAWEGFAEVVELLLQRGAEAAVEDQWGSTVRPA